MRSSQRWKGEAHKGRKGGGKEGGEGVEENGPRAYQRSEQRANAGGAPRPSKATMPAT